MEKVPVESASAVIDARIKELGAARRSQKGAKSYTTQILRSIGVRVVDVRLQPEPNVLVHGKGRRDRCIPLWKKPRGAPRLAIYQEGRSWLQNYLSMLAMDV